jgi:non-ribosomal peptide synthetase component F
MYQWTGQSDLVIGTVSGNRTRTEIEGLIGCFLNFLPIRTKVTGDEDPLEFLDQVNRSVVEAFSHQDCPFSLVVEALNPERKLNLNPIYNVGLLWWAYPGVAFRTESLEAEFVRLRIDVPVLDMRFVGRETPTGIRVDCEYNMDLFDSRTIEQVLDGYREVVEQFVHYLSS